MSDQAYDVEKNWGRNSLSWNPSWSGAKVPRDSFWNDSLIPSNVCPFPLALWAHSDVNPDNDGWAEGRWCSFSFLCLYTMIFCDMAFSWHESQNLSHQSTHLENTVLSIKPWILFSPQHYRKWDATDPLKQCWALQKVTRKPTTEIKTMTNLIVLRTYHKEFEIYDSHFLNFS